MRNFYDLLVNFVCEYLKEDNDSYELDEYIYDIEFDLDNDEKQKFMMVY